MTAAETSLIEQSLAGDPDAFGRLVSQYQSLVCAVTYSLCGDVGRSEELAQETFLTAWKQLGKLEEPSKFKAWLCGIARNRCRNAFRSSLRDASSKAGPIDRAMAIPSAEREPDAEAMNEDESAIVWNALAALPETYREPLVLYYREEQSIRRVAESLELSEDAVKQRLSRGRGMLRARVAALVEGTLTRSKPGPAFTIAVLASLPAVLPPSAAAAVAVNAVATKGSGTAAGGSILSWAFLGPLLGLAGGWLGVRASLNATKTSDERRAVKRMVWQMVLLVLGFFLAMGALMHFGPHHLPQRIFILSLVGLSVTYAAILVTLIVHSNRKLYRLRSVGMTPEEMTPTAMVRRAFEYRSKRSLLGLPWIHIHTGTVRDGKYQQATAKGWLAIGDVAVSPAIAMGKVAIGGIACGALPIGLVAMGGFAIGVLGLGGLVLGSLACGGLAFGWFATGGVALGYEAALGGAAMAKDYALGGVALAEHANSTIAQDYFAHHPVWSPVQQMLVHARWFTILAFIPFLLIPLSQIFARFLTSETQEATITSGWIVECPKCGHAKAFEQTGGIRVAASSYQKRVLGFCPRCRRLRLVAIRKVSECKG